jgi:Cation transporter/ATPase, N-terminus
VSNPFLPYELSLICSSYRTLSIHQTIQPQNEVGPLGVADAAAAIRGLDIHKIPVNDVFIRFSTSPTQGLETEAIQRLARLDRNVIPPPPTQYYKKVLNYIFGGFNFLMWIAFIVTIVCRFYPFSAGKKVQQSPLRSCPTSLSGNLIPRSSISVSLSSW